MHTMLSFIWSVIKPYKYYYFMMALGPIVSALYSILNHYAVKLLIDAFTHVENISYHQALGPISLFVGAQVMTSCGWRLHNYAQLKTIPYVLRDMMEKICHHVFYLPYTYFQNTLSGSISGKMRGIVDKYYSIHQALEFTLTKPLLETIFSGFSLAFVEFKVFVCVLLFSVFYLWVAIKFFTKLANLEQSKQDSWYVLFGAIVDSMQNITNIFSFGTRKNEILRIKNHYKDDLIPISVKYFRYDIFVCIICDLLYYTFLIFVFIWAIYLKNTGQISLGEIAFIISMTLVFVESLWQASFSMKDFFEEVAAFRSAFALMQVPKLQSDYKDVQDYDVLNGEITFKNVTFHFENSKNMFLNLNLHIPAGQKVGLVGYSGAGKSTLIALLLKNFQINEGDIFIDNQNLNCWNSDSLRAQIALIPQDIMLFHRTIVENIGYGNKLATQHQIEQAAKAANIHDDIVNLPEGYNTLVGERGIKLSGGQRQRIAIARAILKNTKILILDEATSSLDSKTEYEIQQSITTLLSDTHATVIAIAHRLSTIKDMDRILVMDKGQIVEDGSFQQLILKENGFFKKLWEHQTDITASV